MEGRRDPLATEEFALGKLDTVNKRQGVCVECTVDCHCGVNEYCGYDYKDTYDKDTKEWSFEYQVTIPPGITSANEGNGMTANAKRFLELHAKQFEGVPLISKCKKYSTSHMKEKPKVCTPEDKLDLDDFGKMVEQSLLSVAGSDDELMRTCNFEDSSRTKRTKVRRTPRYWPKDAQGVSCCRTPLGKRLCGLHVQTAVLSMHACIHTSMLYRERARKREVEWGRIRGPRGDLATGMLKIPFFISLRPHICTFAAFVLSCLASRSLLWTDRILGPKVS